MKFSLKKKSVVFVLLIALIVSIASAGISYNIYAKTIDRRYQDNAMDIASTAASLVDADKIAQYADGVLQIFGETPRQEFDTQEQKNAYFEKFFSVQDDYYSELYTILQNIKTNNRDVLYLYLFVLDEKSHSGIYLIDADETENACPMGTWDIIYPENYEIFENPERGFPAYITRSDFGWLCSAGVPIETDEGKIVGYAMVDVSMDVVKADRESLLRNLILVVACATILLTFIFIAVIGKMVVNPINSLEKATSAFASERERNEESEIKHLNIHTGDEIENLAQSIQKMEMDINRYISNLAVVMAEKERIGAELGIATQIQADMLPSIFPAFPSHPEFDIYATMTPAKEVGGDFYDFFLVDDDHLCIVMADVSGKGVPAALFMVIAKTLLKNCAQTGLSPKQILEIVNNQLCEGNKTEFFVTVWLGVLELSTGKLKAANAGHEYPVMKKAEGSYELIKDRHGFVLAGMEDVRYREYELQFEAGDHLFLYTDGVPEATNGSNEMYGVERMLAALNTCGNAHPMEVLKIMKNDVDRFVGDALPFDDLTMLGLEIKGLPKRYRIDVNPRMNEIPRVTEFVENSLRNEGIPIKVIYKLNIAIDEIFSNIVQYSGATKAAVVCYVRDDMVTMRFEDNGSPFDPLAADDPDVMLPSEEREIGGLGIFMVKKSMDKMRYERKNELNILTMGIKR